MNVYVEESLFNLSVGGGNKFYKNSRIEDLVGKKKKTEQIKMRNFQVKGLLYSGSIKSSKRPSLSVARHRNLVSKLNRWRLGMAVGTYMSLKQQMSRSLK